MRHRSVAAGVHFMALAIAVAASAFVPHTAWAQLQSQPATPVPATTAVANPLAEAIRNLIRTEQYNSNFGLDWSDNTLVGQWLPYTEGNESSLDDEECFTIAESGDLRIMGGFYGKLSYDLEEVEALYAEHGAVGIIDSMCEEAPLRVRLKDGYAWRYTGIIIYPEDEDTGE